MRPIIRVQNISKKYHIGSPQPSYQTLRDAIMEAVRAPLKRLHRRNGGPPSQTIWALRDVSFTVRPGEIVGIIGRNGAGKSTLLKLLSGITEPTSGQVDLYGRIASLLEIGAGFHPELTGRENIYLNGSIMGMNRREIGRNFDEIVAFAEVGKFLDTPVKRYSTGMYMRLAFAVAAHLQPEILVVDEVLAVGDLQFQRKCLGKMGSVSKQGRTVLFVSHNMSAVQSLCSRAIWLDNGAVVREGPTESVVSEYQKVAAVTKNEHIWEDPSRAPGNDQVRLRRASLRPTGGATHPLTIRTPLVLEFEYWNLEPNLHLNLSLVLTNQDENIVFNTWAVKESVWDGDPSPTGLLRSACYIPGDLLNDGIYRVTLAAVKNRGTVLFRCEDVLTFELHDDASRRGAWYGKWPGVIRPDLEWRTELIEADLALNEAAR